MTRRATTTPRVETHQIPFMGGVDTDTPRFAVQSGKIRGSLNVYQNAGPGGGYAVFQGYERYSGQPKPSVSLYSILPVTLTGSVSVGSVVTDNTAASYGTVLLNATTYLVLSKVVGVFAVGNIKIGVTVVGTCSDAQSIGTAGTEELDAEYQALAADLYRADIVPPVGSGPIRGVWYYNSIWYCFRDNAGGTATDMFRDTGSGWVKINLDLELNFTSGGTYIISDGDVVTGEISGASATILKCAMQSGTWGAGDVTGKLILTGKTGNFQAETLRVGGTLNVCTVAGDSTQVAFSNPGGKFDFVNANFTGNMGTLKMYGCDGSNRAFEFDGTVLVPLETGITTFPSHVYEHKKQLFLSFYGSIQQSAPGYPYKWSAVSGEDEIGLGDKVTGFISQPGSDNTAALAVFSTKETHILYGSSVADWNLTAFKRDVGALEFTPQFVGTTLFCDNRGITKLNAAQIYGNFVDSTISQHFSTLYNQKKNQISCSCVSRDKNLYCLFFNDKTGIFCAMYGGKLMGATEMLFAHKVTCVCSAEDGSGNETIMFGSDDGHVYQMFSGKSFDGALLSWYMDLVYDFIESPTFSKRFLKCTLDLSGVGYSLFQFGWSVEYDDVNYPQVTLDNREIIQSPAFWDSFTWDSFTWDGAQLTPEKFDMMGSGVNIALRFTGYGTYNSPLLFSGALLQYYLQRGTR
jgi:hypothetical protein